METNILGNEISTVSGNTIVLRNKVLSEVLDVNGDHISQETLGVEYLGKLVNVVSQLLHATILSYMN